MAKKYLDDNTFNQCLEIFIEKVRAKQEEETLSFSSGHLYKEEGYKKEIALSAREKLKDVTKGEYIDWILSTYKYIAVSDENIKNNLMDWREVDKHLKKLEIDKRDKVEDILHRLYRGEGDDGVLFDELVEQIGDHYSVIPYVFFLKDSAKYIPVRRYNFMDRFDVLGLSKNCFGSCKWENYQVYLEIMKDVQQHLIDSGKFKGEISLLDAHSFVWMMHLLQINVEEWKQVLSAMSDKEEYLRVLACFKDYGESVTCTQLAEKYGGHYNQYSVALREIGKKAYELTNCKIDNNDYLSLAVKVGKAAKKTPGEFALTLRSELSDALKSFDLSGINLYIEPSTPEEPTAPTNHYGADDFLAEVYVDEPVYKKMCSVLGSKKNLILQGAPGVGKTFAAKRLAYSLMPERDEDCIEFVQFHQNYSYEDFVMGYKPADFDSGFALKNGVFYRFCEKAKENLDKNFYFIIDEINRGNMSKIFGELLMLIESDYRGESVTLAYKDEKFFVPENLYIIGMMNTADRSLAMIDYALRRRFGFVKMEPAFENEKFEKFIASIESETLVKLVDQVKSLNEEIENDKSLGKGFRIGHSYFCGLTAENCNEEALRNIIECDIVPMLEEYWFDDEKKVEEWADKLNGVFN